MPSLDFNLPESLENVAIKKPLSYTFEVENKHNNSKNASRIRYKTCKAAREKKRR